MRISHKSFPWQIDYFPSSRSLERESPKLKRSHGDRLVDPGLDVPARRKAGVREKRMDARDGLLWILSVHFVFRLAILFRNGEDAQALDGFERVGGLGIEHTQTKKEIVAAINECQRRKSSNQDSFREDEGRNCDGHPLSEQILCRCKNNRCAQRCLLSQCHGEQAPGIRMQRLQNSFCAAPSK